MYDHFYSLSLCFYLSNYAQCISRISNLFLFSAESKSFIAHLQGQTQAEVRVHKNEQYDLEVHRIIKSGTSKQQGSLDTETTKLH